MPQIPAEVQVRPGVEADLRALTDIYNHYVLETALTFDTASFTPQERLPWLRSHPQDGPHRLLVALDPDTRHDTPHVLGYATSGPYRPKAAYSTTLAAWISVRRATCRVLSRSPSRLRPRRFP